MCARYTLVSTKELIEKWFKADVKGELKPKYNVAPMQEMPLILNSEPERINFATWGFQIGNGTDAQLLINCRSETIFHLPAFRESAENRRCLVIADGFYEWKTQGKNKVPIRFSLKNEPVFAMAGIWKRQLDKNGNFTTQYSVLTTQPNELIAKVHNRMPVILDRSQYTQWLNTLPETKTFAFQEMFKPFASDKMQAQLVSPLVNSTANEGPELWIDRQLGLGL